MSDTKMITRHDFEMEDEFFAVAFIDFVQNIKNINERYPEQFNPDVELTYSQFKSMVKRKKCMFTGTTLDNDLGIRGQNDNSLRLARYDNNKPFSKSNTYVTTKAMLDTLSYITNRDKRDSDMVNKIVNGLPKFLEVMNSVKEENED